MKLLRHLVKRGARAQPGWVLLPVFGYFVLTSAYLNALLECVQQLLCADVNAEHSGGGGANASWAVGCNDAEVTARTAHVGSIMTLAYSVPTIVSVGVVGLIADSRGRKVGLVVANASQALASCAVLAVLLLRAVMGRAAVSVWWLLVSAICGALGGGYPVFLSSAFSYTADTSRRARRGASFALLEGAAFAGFIVGPLIFGELTKNVESGYEWFFTIHALGSVLIAGFCALIPESMRSESAQNNASGALVEPLLAVGEEESASAAAAAAAAPASASAPPGLGGMVTNGINQPTAAELSRGLRERAAPIGATMTPWSDVEWCDANVISSLYITVAAHGEKRTRWGLAVVGVAFALQHSATIGLMYVGIVFTSQVFHWDDGTIGAWSSARAVVSAVAAVGAAAALRCCAGCEEHAARRNLSGHRWHSEGRSRGGGSACFDERESFGDEKREGGFTMPYNNLDASFAAADRPFFDGPTSPSRTLSMSRQSFDGSSAGTATTQERLRSNTLSSINSAEMMPRDHEFGGGKMFFCCCSAPIRNRCCDALVRLRGCTRCPGHWGRTIGAAPGEVGANELCTARIAVAVGTLGFFLAALTPKLVDSVTLFWVATLLASVQQMATPCLRAVFSACANDALQGQALGAIAALEVFVASVASPALQSIFRQSAAVDRPLSAPKGSTPWQAFEAFVEGAAIGPSSVLCVFRLLSLPPLAPPPSLSSLVVNRSGRCVTLAVLSVRVLLSLSLSLCSLLRTPPSSSHTQVRLCASLGDLARAAALRHATRAAQGHTRRGGSRSPRYQPPCCAH